MPGPSFLSLQGWAGTQELDRREDRKFYTHGSYPDTFSHPLAHSRDSDHTLPLEQDASDYLTAIHHASASFFLLTTFPHPSLSLEGCLLPLVGEPQVQRLGAPSDEGVDRNQSLCMISCTQERPGRLENNGPACQLAND